MNLENYKDQKILIVDDNPKNLQVAMNILKDFNVIYAQSGNKALKLLEENEIDLILLDIVMPGIDGFEVCRVLKSNEKTKDIPVIFLTVKDDEKDIVDGLELGAVDYVTKPFYSEVLIKRVNLHLKLSNNYKNLNLINKELNEIVEKQIKQLRQKDKILFKQSKVLAVSEMIDMMTEQLSYPLFLIKIQNQALELKESAGILENEDIRQTIKTNDEQLNYLSITINDFKTFFKQEAQCSEINLNVIINSVLLFFKDMFIKDNINVKVIGDINQKVFFVRSELKHLLMKLIFDVCYLFKDNDVENKEIEIRYSKNKKNTEIQVISNNNIHTNKFNTILNALENEIVSSEVYDFDLGLSLLKMIVEKNNSSLKIEKKEHKLYFIILCENI